MELFGSVAKYRYTFGRWYLEMPEFWCKSADYVRTHPYLNHPKQGWGEINTDSFEFFTLNLDCVQSDKVFDLRGNNWRQRLSTFTMWFGQFGWSSPGGLWKETSPLDTILYLGNYNVIAARGYRWIVLDHGPDNNGDFIELWYYAQQNMSPDSYYEMQKLNSQEFLQ